MRKLTDDAQRRIKRGSDNANKLKRDKALEAYYKNPNYCNFCEKVIKVKDNESVYEASRRKFCNRSCAASINNIGKVRNGKPRKIRYCLNCRNELSGASVKYCDQICKNEYEYKQYINKWVNGDVSGQKGKYGISNYIRRYLFEKYDNSCQECGQGIINPYTNRVPLDIHHVDGNSLNNKPENLQLLCKNCHALTENYGSRNKNNTVKTTLPH